MRHIRGTVTVRSYCAPPASSSHILIYYGLTGQGKTSLLCSLVTSKKKGSKVYRLGGVFDKIYICGRQLLEDGGGKGPRVR